MNDTPKTNDSTQAKQSSFADSHRGRLLRGAYHEAGHAVVGWAVGRRIRSIKVCRYGLSGAVTNFQPDEYTEDVVWAVQTVAVLLAGYMAARRGTSDPRNVHARGARDDVSKIKAILQELPRLSRINFLLTGGRMAKSFLRIHWDEVERVAQTIRRGGIFRGDVLFPAAPRPLFAVAPPPRIAKPRPEANLSAKKLRLKASPKPKKR